MAQVRTKPVKGHNEYVDAEDCQQVDLVAEQEHKASDRDALNKRTSRCEDQPFDGVGACHGQWGLCFGAVMELVEVPQGRNPVQCEMHHETREIVKEKEKQSEAERCRPVAGTFEQPERDHCLPVQQFKDQRCNGKLCHQYGAQPEKNHAINLKRGKVLAARTA